VVQTVVKRIVENAVDANASDIKLIIKEAGESISASNR
jgi:DNA mismatch repair ATPase MutL